jgi:phage shock protein A
MTLAAVRRVLELEDQVRALEAERDALREAVAQLGETVARLERRWAQRQEP